MGQALATIYHNDLPVFVSTDIILYALHASYDQILKEIEGSTLLPNLQSALDLMYSAIPKLAEAYGGNSALRTAIEDVDIYVTVAKSLIDDTPSPPQYAAQEMVDNLLAAIRAEQYVVMPLFSERNRRLDFSQFTVRGHYINNSLGVPLGAYFKCMMWCGRMDFFITPPPVDPIEEPWSREEIRRMVIGAVMLDELIDLANARGLLAENDKITSFMVGESDNLTPEEMSAVRASEGITAANLLDDALYDSFQAAVEDSPGAEQRILSSFFAYYPYNGDIPPLPVSYRLMGQRFIVDSYVFSQVVFPHIIRDGEKVFRPMPDPLDALFALGNDDVLPLLEDELDRYQYAPNLAAQRYLVDAYDDDFWGGSLYNTWLSAIRALNPPEDTSRFPLFMQTTAWQQEKMNTQLASWAQLRHDNLLYAKQSSPGYYTCSFPHSYVEPYPAFYATLGGFANMASVFFNQYSDNETMDKVVQHYQRYGEIMAHLEAIAEKELAREQFSEDDCEFLATMLYEAKDGCNIIFSGWVTELFYQDRDEECVDLTIVDVHTQPTDGSGNVLGRVLHVGTGLFNLGVFIVESPSNGFTPTAFVGPVMSYYEHTTENFDRLTDERWWDMVWDGSLPERPDWVNAYLADRTGHAFAEGRELPGVLYSPTTVDDGEEVPSAFVLAQNTPNPFNPSTTINWTLLDGDKTKVEIFNINGQKLAILLDEWREAGHHSTVWDASAQAAGLYFCRVTSGANSKVMKMMLVK